MPNIPLHQGDLTPDWFTETIGAGARCLDVATTPIGVGVGLVGQLFACELSWDGGTAPTNLVAKLAAEGVESRFVAMVLNMYGREVGFYNELATHTSVPHPKCFYADHNVETHDTVLLLENVSAYGKQFDQVNGATLAQATPAIRTIARLHADWWDNPKLDDYPWLRKLSDDPYPGAVQMAIAAGWPVVQEYMADLINPAVQRLGDSFVDNIPAIFAQCCDGPLTLAHADWRLDNLFFAADPTQPVMAVDWQLVDRSCGPRDVAYLVTQSLELSDPAQYVEALDIYLDELAALGVIVDRDWALLSYRRATRFGFVYPIVAGGSLTVEDPRHHDLCRALMRRCATAMEALDTFNLAL